MKKILVSCVAILMVASSCNSSTNKTTTTDTVITSNTLAKAKATPVNTPTVYSLCFLNKQGKDSTSIELVVHGDKVTGQMNWLPYQKDSRKGTIDGTIKDDTLQATWTFMQEGMKDTLKLNFRFKDGQLAQKPLKLNAKTGREQTDESAGYRISYASSTKLNK